MNKSLVCLVILFFLLAPMPPVSRAQIYNEDFSRPQKLNLFKQNKVWMVYGWRFLYTKGEQEKKGKKISFERFDRSGNRTEELYFDGKGNSTFSCQYLFNDNGNEVNKMGAASDEVIYEAWNYSFSENGSRVEKKSAYRKLQGQKWIYTLDAHKNIALEEYYDVSGTVAARMEYAYDAKQNITEKKELDAYGNVYQKWVYKYDDKGNNIDLYHYISNNLFRVYHMIYDKKGNMKSKFTFDKDEKTLELVVFVYQFYEGLHAPRTIGNKQ